jgi:hypothetical protein
MFAKNGLQRNVTQFFNSSNFPVKLPIFKIINMMLRLRPFWSTVCDGKGPGSIRVQPMCNLWGHKFALERMFPQVRRFSPVFHTHSFVTSTTSFPYVQRYVTKKTQRNYRPVSEDAIIVMLSQIILTSCPYIRCSCSASLHCALHPVSTSGFYYPPVSWLR